MYTRCPQCLTCFRVTARHLAIANGRVRCGKCQQIFNAPQHAVDDVELKPVNEKSTSTLPGTPEARISKPEHSKMNFNSKKSEEENTVHRITERTASTVRVESVKSQAKLAKKTPVKKSGIKEPAIKKSRLKNSNAEKPIINNPALSHEESLVEGSTSLNNDVQNEIDLDSSFAMPENYTNKEGDKLVPEVIKSTNDIPIEDSSNNVFISHVYDPTNTASVEDILEEIENQLSLNIELPEQNKIGERDDNSDDAFDSFILNEKTDNSINKTVDSFADTNKMNFNGKDKIPADKFQSKRNNLNPDGKAPGNDKNTADTQEVSEVPIQLRGNIERLQLHQRRQWHPLLRFTIIIILVLVSFIQLIYFRAYELLNLVPSAHPVVERVCAEAHCQYSGPHDIDQIELISRDVRQHPNVKNALLISAAMVNQAKFSQPYPDIQIKLSDISGNVIAERLFNAKTYLGKFSSPFLLMKSRIPVHVNFEVIDPGEDAVNFEFTFR